MGFEMKLSKNFTLAELTYSATAVVRKIDNEPSSRQIENLKILCREILQKCRDNFGAPAFVTSGYRCPELNSIIGGAKYSHHQCLDGFAAADLMIDGVSAQDLYNHIKNSDYPFEQVINEYDAWVHVSIRVPRRQAMVKKA